MSFTERHPKWKALYDLLLPMLQPERLFSYDELRQMLGGMDPQGREGRCHILRTIREIRGLHDLHLENVRGEGYRVVKPGEHAGCATARARLAKRKMHLAREILMHTQVEKLNGEELKVHEHIGKRIVFQLEVLTREVRSMRREIAQSHERLPHPLLEPGKEDQVN